MADFLHGWRRKIGLVILGMALLLTVGWFRSMVIQDECWTVIGGDMYGINSANSDLEIYRELTSAHDMRGDLYGRVGYLHAGRPTFYCNLPTYGERWRHSVAGFSIECVVNLNGELNRLGQARTFHVIRCPYWEPILVLTLVAAALILPPPRRVARRPSEAPSVTSTVPSAG